MATDRWSVDRHGPSTGWCRQWRGIVLCGAAGHKPSLASQGIAWPCRVLAERGIASRGGGTAR